MYIKVCEHREHNNRHKKRCIDQIPGNCTVLLPESPQTVHKNGNELRHLQNRNVLLPPDISLHLWPIDGEVVVAIHNDVHKQIEESRYYGMTSETAEAYYKVSGNGHKQVVEQMQCRYLLITLSQHYEDGVQQIEILVQVVQIGQSTIEHLFGMIHGHHHQTAHVVGLILNYIEN